VTDLKQKKIGILMGGPSAEREVSLRTGRGVHQALGQRGFECTALDWLPGANVSELVTGSGAEVVWLALHGTKGEDGAIQGLLTCLDIPFTGSGITASAVAMDKLVSKGVLLAAAIPTPRAARVGPKVSATSILKEWQPPFVIKPIAEGSSVGVSIVRTVSDVQESLASARQAALAGTAALDIMVEDFIPGAEIHTAVLDGELLGSVEVQPAGDFYDYQAKYERADTRYLVPPELDSSLLADVEKLAVQAYREVGCRAHARVDMRVDRAAEGPRGYVLEVNTLPGMTETSLLPKIAAAAGLDYGELCERILATAAVG
jgi:D-alanine-D-alanine ligase